MGNKSRTAIIALVLGIVCFLNLFGIEKAIVAIIAGWMGLKEAEFEAKTGRGLAVAGIVLGSIYIVVIAVLLIVKGPDFISMLRSMRH